MAAKAGKTAAKASKVTKVSSTTSDEEGLFKQAPVDKKVPTHPPIADMVTEAIGKQTDRGGSSLLAIKRSIAESHDVDVEKLAPFIKRYLKKAVETGVLTQPTGKGAAGSFKLAAKPKPTKKPVGEKIEKPAGEAKAKKTAAKKAPFKAPSPSSGSASDDEEISLHSDSASDIEEKSPSPKKAPAKAKAPKPATPKARSPKVPKKPAEKKKAPDAPTNSKASPKTKLPPKVKPAAKSKTARKSSSPTKGATRKS